MSFQLVVPRVFQLTHGGTNVFLIEANGWILIDTGTPDMGELILDGIVGLGVNPKELRTIVLTHCHPDHAGSAAFLKDRLNVDILCHQTEAELLQQGIGVRESFAASPGLLNRLLFHAIIAGSSPTVKPVEIDRFVSDGEELIGGLQVIHTPGHCSGHISLLWNKTLVAGDAAFNVGRLRPHFACESYPTSLESIQKLCQLDFDNACFGHGPAILASAGERFRKRQWSQEY